MAKTAKTDKALAASRRAVKEHATFSYATGKSSLGTILVASSEMGVVSVMLGQSAEGLVRGLQERFPKAALVHAGKDYAPVLAHVIECINKPQTVFTLPLDIRGTEFQRRVWRAVRKIPLGQTSTYSDIAAQISKPRAVRAVGSSCTHNHFFLIIPCHRVLRKNGLSSGDWGSTRQKMLIEREIALKA